MKKYIPLVVSFIAFLANASYARPEIDYDGIVRRAGEILEKMPKEKNPTNLEKTVEGTEKLWILQRDNFSNRSTTGVLYEDVDGDGCVSEKDKKLCYTLELPWRENKRNVSCIPEGAYTLRENGSSYPKNHFCVDNVPDRTGILIHPGNYPQDTQGCILPGRTRSKDSVGSSRLALKDLEKVYSGQKLKITSKKASTSKSP